MSRGNTAAMDAALGAQVHRPILFGKFGFDSGEVRLWTGKGELTFNSEVYTGAGETLAVEYPQESADGVANGATFEVSGIDSAWIAVSLTEHFQGRAAELYYGEFDATWVLVADPILIFKGVVDLISARDDGGTSQVTMTIERPVLDNRPPGGLYDSATQQRLFAGDLFFDALPALQEVAINWGVPGDGGAQSAPRPVASVQGHTRTSFGTVTGKPPAPPARPVGPGSTGNKRNAR